MTLHRDFKEFIQLLNRNKVEYLLIGGYAVVLHGYYRLTGDIDFWIKNSPENAKRMIKVMDEFGFGVLQLQAKDFEKEGEIVQLGYPPYRIDLLTSADGIQFDDCYAKRIELPVEKGITIKLIDLESLKKNKLASGRDQDLIDVQHLKKDK